MAEYNFFFLSVSKSDFTILLNKGFTGFYTIKLLKKKPGIWGLTHQCVSCLSSWRLILKIRCLPSCLDPNKMTSQDQRQRKKSCVFCSRDFLAERLEGDKFCSKNTELLNALSPRIFIVLLKNLAEICFS